MATDNRFRRQLAKSLDTWVADALITEEQRDRFRQYYQLDRLHLEANSRFTTVLLTFGAVLVGLGAISFVAANWERLLPSVRAIGVLTVMLAFDIGGYWLFRGSGQSKNYRKLGSALLSIGQLMLGASIGLMAQWFQVGGSPAGLYFWWGVGVLGVAFTARHNLSGVLAIVLLQLTWFEEPTPLAPVVVLAIFLPLAYWCRSRWMFAAVVLATNVSTVWAIFDRSDVYSASAYWFWFAYISLTSAWWAFSITHQRALPRILLWLPSDVHGELATNGGATHRPNAENLDFAPFARILSMFGLLGALSLLSFEGFYTVWDDGWLQVNLVSVLQDAPFLTATIWGFGLLSILLWGFNIRDRFQTAARATAILDIAVGIVSASMALRLHAGLPSGHTAFAFNLLLFGLACTLVWSGLQLGTRWYYWVGLLAITLQILSRFFEYDTGLLLKSIVLIVCGIGTIAAGISFERRLQHSPPNAQLPEQ